MIVYKKAEDLLYNIYPKVKGDDLVNIKELKLFIEDLEDDMKICTLGYGGQGGVTEPRKIKLSIEEVTTYEGMKVKMLVVK